MRIALIRHGQPAADSNPRLNAAGFADWVRAFDVSGVAPSSTPPPTLRARLNSFHAVASSLPRSAHSVQLCLGRDADSVLPDIREMDIPCYPLPLRLRAWHWVFLNRALWIAGVQGSFESFQEAKRRCQGAAIQFEDLARTYENLAVFGHGFSNLFIGRSLRARGWRGISRPLAYWEANWLTR